MMKKLAFFLLLTIYYLIFNISVRAAPIIPPGGGGGFNIRGVFQPADAFGTFGDLATTILTILTSAAGVIAVFFIIAAGIKFVTASGDEKKLASAASMITYAIIGLVVTALAFVILQIVQYFFGANVGTI